MAEKLTKAQAYMMERLKFEGPFDAFDMTIAFGRSWQRVWDALEEKGLVKFAPYAKDGRHYRVVR